MVVMGIDPHKHNHTAVAVDDNGRELGQVTVGGTAAELVRLLDWAQRWPDRRRWAVEDCRHVAGALLRALVRAGQTVVTVPPKLMAQARASARTRGKSDPIDALAVARAALREPDLPEAHLDEQALEIRLLLDHREVAERTRMINRLQWHLHDLEISLPAGQALNRIGTLHRLRDQIGQLAGGVRAEIAAELIERTITLTRRVSQLNRRIEAQIQPLAVATHLLILPGCAGLTAAKILAETAGVGRFRSAAAFAMHAGTAPIPVWTGNHTRFRLNRGGNRQLNAALHRIAITQLRMHPPAQALVQRRIAAGRSKTEALRVLRRHLADIVYHRLRADTPSLSTCHQNAA